MPEPVPEFEFALVGSWAAIPVADPAAASRAVRRLVDESIGRADELATFRHGLRSMLDDSVAGSRRGNGQMMYLAREIVPGIPLLATLTIAWPPLAPLPVSVGTRPKAARAMLKQMLIENLGGADDTELELEQSVALRRASVVPAPIADGADSLRLDYWVSSPIPGRFVLFAFSTPLLRIRDQVTTLFDTMVESIRWDAAAPGSTDGEVTA